MFQKRSVIFLYGIRKDGKIREPWMSRGLEGLMKKNKKQEVTRKWERCLRNIESVGKYLKSKLGVHGIGMKIDWQQD